MAKSTSEKLEWHKFTLSGDPAKAAIADEKAQRALNEKREARVAGYAAAIREKMAIPANKEVVVSTRFADIGDGSVTYSYAVKDAEVKRAPKGSLAL